MYEVPDKHCAVLVNNLKHHTITTCVEFLLREVPALLEVH
jgi:hypothetical protein